MMGSHHLFLGRWLGQGLEDSAAGTVWWRAHHVCKMMVVVMKEVDLLGVCECVTV